MMRTTSRWCFTPTKYGEHDYGGPFLGRWFRKSLFLIAGIVNLCWGNSSKIMIHWLSFLTRIVPIMAGSRVTSGSIRKPEINTRESMGTYLRQVQRYLARPWMEEKRILCVLRMSEIMPYCKWPYRPPENARSSTEEWKFLFGNLKQDSPDWATYLEHPKICNDRMPPTRVRGHGITIAPTNKITSVGNPQSRSTTAYVGPYSQCTTDIWSFRLAN